MSWNDMIGRRLGQYTILEEIGRGGSSRVYRARNGELARDVAIKVIPNDAEDRVGFVRRFEREVRAVAQLNHPNIVSVYDRGETDDLVFLIMECVMGGTLKQRMGRPLPTPEAASAIMQMARALHHAHQRGIVHRDVKPSNMLVDMNNAHHVLLTDFGIAKLQGARGLTKSGTTIGTPEYMSPEQAEGKEIDPRADVYALGCVLYETLSGRPPFVGSTPVSVLYQQVHSRPAYIRGFNPDVPRELARVVDQALAKRPEDRFGTAESLAEALLPFTGGLVEPPTHLTGAPPSAPRTSSTPAFPLPAPEPPESLGPPDPVSPPAPPVRPASGDMWILNQQSRSASLPQPPPRPVSSGLGQEGLDALFPGDRPAPPMPAGAGPLGPQPDAMPPVSRAPTSSGRLTGAPIPLPNFRLPARTRPLSLPLTSDGRLDTDRLMRREQEGARRYQAGPTSDIGDMPRVLDGQDSFGLAEQPGQSRQYVPGGQSATPPRIAHDTPTIQSGEPETALRRALRASGQPPSRPQTVWRPDAGDTRNTAPTSRARKPPVKRGRRPIWAGAVVAAVLLIVVIGWLAVFGSGLGFTQKAQITPAATSTVAPTPLPTDTPQPSATATATTSPQQIANRKAANSFAGVTLATFVDHSCSGANSTSRFAAGGAVYVNLCVGGQPAATTMTVAIRQHGVVLYTLVSGQFVSPGASYWYARFGLPAGTYDMLVTMPIDGTAAVARDLTFTVG